MTVVVLAKQDYRTLEARIAELIADSVRVDRNDPRWQATARGRQWMRHWPGVLSL